jgi:putative holliday junction resolvase
VTSATPASFRRGPRIGVDVGSVRVGVARCDPDGILAVPVATLARSPQGADLDSLVELVVEHEPLELVVGLPLGLDGREGAAAQAARDYAVALAERLRAAGRAVPVRLVDERLSTAAATRGLQAAGRDARSARGVVDQAAAVIIVQHAVDAERATGTPPGVLLEPGEDPNR